MNLLPKLKQIPNLNPALGLLAARDLGTILPDDLPYTNIATTGAIGRSFAQYASSIFGFLTIVAGLAFMLYFVLGAVKWITSGGDKGQVESARDQMTAAAIGLIAVIASYTIAGIVSLVLGINILNPGMELQKIVP